MLYICKNLIIGMLIKVLERLHCPLEVVLTCIRCYAAYPLRLRHVEKAM